MCDSFSENNTNKNNNYFSLFAVKKQNEVMKNFFQIIPESQEENDGESIYFKTNQKINFFTCNKNKDKKNPIKRKKSIMINYWLLLIYI